MLLQDPVIISALGSYHYECQISLIEILMLNQSDTSTLLEGNDFLKNKNTEWHKEILHLFFHPLPPRAPSVYAALLCLNLALEYKEHICAIGIQVFVCVVALVGLEVLQEHGYLCLCTCHRYLYLVWVLQCNKMKYFRSLNDMGSIYMMNISQI
jgi:hypothetical protein